MRKKLSFALALSAMIALAAGAGTSTTPHYIAIKNVAIIDAASTPARSDFTVLIEGNRIQAIERSDRLRLPKDAEVIDGHGKFLIPGLWDMHVHIAAISADPAWSREVLLPLLVANGITGIRDMGGDLGSLQTWRKQIEEGSLAGPRIFACGPMLDPGGQKPSPEMMSVRTPIEAHNAVIDLQKRGADFIKVLSGLNKETYYAVAQESRAQHLDFVGHVPNSISAAEASDAGQKSIEHIFYSNLVFDCSTRGDELRQRRLEAMEKKNFGAIGDIINEANDSYSAEKAAGLGRKLRANGTWLVPTLVGIYPLGHFDELSADTSKFKYLPEKLTKEWALEKLKKQYPPRFVDFYRRQSDNERKILRDLHDAGAGILAGSDSLDLLNVCGFSLHQELAQLVQAGLSPREALRSATLDPASFLNKQKELGTIEPGKLADLVLLDANPLDDIHNTEKIRAVFVGGRVFLEADIQAMLQRAAKFAASVPG
jgi:imidazolonepropionase-like amidohydrolase